MKKLFCIYNWKKKDTFDIYLSYEFFMYETPLKSFLQGFRNTSKTNVD